MGFKVLIFQQIFYGDINRCLFVPAPAPEPWYRLRQISWLWTTIYLKILFLLLQFHYFYGVQSQRIVQSKIQKLLPRFTRSCGMPFVLASISGPIQSKNSKASGHAIYFGLNLRSNSEQKFESFCLASLGYAIYFRFNLRSNSEQKFESFCLASLGRVIYFGFNLRSNSEKKNQKKVKNNTIRVEIWAVSAQFI